jgi:adenylosuccinate synthase
VVARVILLSGPVAAGKSALARQLQNGYDATLLKTADQLTERLGNDAPADRAALQAVGEELDRATEGRWVVDALVRRFSDLPSQAIVVVDAVRIQAQIDAVREAYGRRVVHLHITASDATLAARYDRRKEASPGTELADYDQVRANPTEHGVPDLATEADVVIDTDRCRPDDVLARAVACLGVNGSSKERLADLLVGGQYGSEGKGNVAAYLAPEYQLLVRSGGPNAGHSVMTSSGRHVQHHLPSGTRLSDARLLLTAGAVLDPDKLLDEIACSHVDRDRLSIDPNATVITPQHREAERALVATIGSTGSGVGAATADRIMCRGASTVLAKDIDDLQAYLRDGGEVLEAAWAQGARVFVEGTQGTGLSLLHGNYPYVTSRDTTASGLLAEAGVPPGRVDHVIMVCRTYPIRVDDPDGDDTTSGPMGLEIAWEEIAARSGLDLDELLRQEQTTTTGRKRRVAEFDWQLLRRAAQLNRPTDLAVTFVDQLHAGNTTARRFDQLHPDTVRFVQEIERVAETPVSLISTRFHQRSIIDRRNW